MSVKKVNELEKVILELKSVVFIMNKRITILENNNKINNTNVIVIQFHKKFGDSKEYYFDKYDKEEIRKFFSAGYVYETFSKGNKYLYGGYYNDGINNSKNLVLSDTEESLDEQILELGRSE
jgi:hypothetical protein